mgnify:CR=1 FL=1
MKVIAFYLPQFHKVPENDQWWGEGYTEWTAVKAAEKLYENHYQPHIPLNDNYYDLMQKDTMLWQLELMKKYNVYGMCFYHYYFQNGRKILEKPAENLLKWKNIDMPFCFSWANVTWSRTWSKISANTWNKYLDEKKHCESDDGVLLLQDYGGEKEWEDHFNYLLPFFKDERYIKKEGNPIFLIYQPDHIINFPQMKEKWNALAQKNQLQGICFVATNSDREGFDAYLRQEPAYSGGIRKKVIWDYDKFVDKMLENAVLAQKNCYLCGLTGFDETPRQGESSKIIDNSSPQKFYQYMRKLFWLGDKKGNTFTFVNAWNEWGEGMHLEPDEKYRYGYLEALKKALSDYHELDENAKHELQELIKESNTNRENELEKSQIKRANAYMRLYDKWLYAKECEKNLQTYFEDMGYGRIAIYGLGRAGRHLQADLEKAGIRIEYGIDRMGEMWKDSFPVYKPDEALPIVDAIVVTVIYDFDSVYQELKGKFSRPIISLEEIVDYVVNKSQE